MKKSLELSSDKSSCECFYARSKNVKYWIDKLVAIAMDFDGTNDFMRQLNYHQNNGTDAEFLGFNGGAMRAVLLAELFKLAPNYLQN